MTPTTTQAVALPETITLLGQWKCDGTQKAIRTDDMMFIQTNEDGGVYVRPEDAIAFFGLIPATTLSSLQAEHTKEVNALCKLANDNGQVANELKADLDALRGRLESLLADMVEGRKSCAEYANFLNAILTTSSAAQTGETK